MTTFQDLGLTATVLRGVQAAGYTTPTPIQAATIPVALAGADVTGCAQTGTGKTAAFVLPLLDRLARTPAPRQRVPRALVVTPTRELAVQVEAAVRTYGVHTGLRSVALYGGVSMEPQFRALHRGVDIVIATPGRLLDHLDRGSISLAHLQVLVLDEADRMFDMGFVEPIRAIVAATPETRQTLLFSATMPPKIQALAARIQRAPQTVDVGQRRDPAATVTQHVYRIAQGAKVDLLLHLIATENVDRLIVFSRTKHRADKIAEKLEKQGVRAAAIHANRSQSQRQRALTAFRSGSVRVLVATDVAARGLDIDGVSHVVNFDTPDQPDAYIHRIGRTGRAQQTGDAVTFVAPDEEPLLRQIERHTGLRFPRQGYPGFEAAPPSDVPNPLSRTRAEELAQRSHRPQRHPAPKPAAKPKAGPHGAHRPHATHTASQGR